jgi:hypothetical protein
MTSYNELRSYIKGRYPDFWDHLIKARWSGPVRAVGSLPNALYGRALRHVQSPHFFVDIRGMMGMGATLSIAVQVLDHCDRIGTVPYLRFTNPLYSMVRDGYADWLGLHFDRLRPAPPLDGRRFLIVRNGEWDLGRSTFHPDLTVERAHRLFFDHFDFKPEIVDVANAFFDELPANSLGVHFRGTDKRLETPRVTWSRVVDAIEEERQDSTGTVFVATDEPEFLDFICDALGPNSVVHLDCQGIYSGGRPVHFTDGDPFTKAREALTTMLVLSKFDTCIRTPSHLSAWANIINPAQRIIMLGRPSRSAFVFPDRQIWETWASVSV